MSSTLNAFATRDDFGPGQDGGELVAPDTRRVRLLVFNNAIAWRYGYGSPPRYDEPEMHLTPGTYSFDQVCGAIQVRSWVKGVPAIVTAQMLTGPEIGESGDDEQGGNSNG